MSKFQLRKGNLYNQLENRVDRQLIDSNQYDLQLTIDDKTEYFRVRLEESRFEATPVKLDEKKFYLPSFSSYCDIHEIDSFRKTDFYKKDFQYRKELEQQSKSVPIQQRGFSEYYYFLKRITRKNIFPGSVEYSFSVPAIGERQKEGVISYDVSIESIKKYYYLIFLKEHMQRYYYQGNKELYMIYNKRAFNGKKTNLENKILNICSEGDYQLGITELLYLVVGNDMKKLVEIYSDIDRARKKQDITIFLRSKSFNILEPTLKNNASLLSELNSYINNQKDDIDCDFKSKIYTKKRLW